MIFYSLLLLLLFKWSLNFSDIRSSAIVHIMKYLNRSVYSIFIFFGATAFWSLPVAYGGSCSEAKLCCPGRDSSCVVQKTPINSISEDVNEKPCYCDHACLKLGDCCPDFKKACKGKRYLIDKRVTSRLIFFFFRFYFSIVLSRLWS